jgi:lipopolysaccharide export system protein LptA
MRFLVLVLTVLITSLYSEELKVVADSFEADEKQGLSIFKGNVGIKKGSDEMNASMVTIHIDKNRHPTSYEAVGNVNFFITTEDNSTYTGKAQKAVFIPNKKEYKFSGDVELIQLNKKKKIVGDDVVVNMIKGTAVAVGKKNRPVIMIFELEEEK